MPEYVNLFLSVFMRFFFLLTPFAVVSSFLSMTRDFDEERRSRTARQVTVAVVVIAFALYLFGKYIFLVFGVTLDSFRVGAGALLFLAAVSLMRGAPEERLEEGADHMAVVPLALPITVGPATTGAILVMSADPDFQDLSRRIVASAALFAAICCVGALLHLSTRVERLLGRIGLVILSKITGLFLASLAAEIMLTGIRNALWPSR